MSTSWYTITRTGCCLNTNEHADMILEALSMPFFQRALIAGALACVACGMVGSVVVVKRMASISGGLSHAAFGGVGLGFLMGFEPLLGAAVFALLSAVGIGIAHRYYGQSMDALIAMVWPIGMALGITLVSLSPGYAPDLMSYLFGSILYVSPAYLYGVIVLDLVIVAAVAVYYRRLEAVLFEEEFAHVAGIGVNRYFLVVMALVALTVVILMRLVGAILVIALLTIPAVVARSWTFTLRRMMLLSALLGAGCVVVGLFAAYALDAWFGMGIPTGPLIILTAAVLYGADTLVQLIRGNRAR